MDPRMTNRTNALIICNGPLPPRRRIAPLIAGDTLIICADGGANRALARGIIPHLIIGDLDSLTPRTAAALQQVQKIRVEDQNSTDLAKALEYLVQRGVGRAAVIGATGRRPDHELANFSILAKYHSRLEVTFVDAWCRMQIIDRTVQLPLKPGTTLSLMPLGKCEGITTRGLAWPLNNETLELGVREGNSNRVTASPVEISLMRGKLLLFIVDRN
jgi:thiamine pyrophosphokinase